MITLAWAAAALALLPLILAALNLLIFARPQARPPAGTAVSILIPARNEAKTIAETVRRALASTVVEVEVLVLDDDSTDDTAGIVSRLAERDRRVRLLRAPPLSPGWAGKQRACHLLSEQARFETLMFIDADLLLASDAAASAAGFLLADERRGLVSGFPREVAVSWAEQLVIPWIHVLLLGYLPMYPMRRSNSPAYAAACGQWVVARRSAYREVRGHAASPDSLHDGLSLPRVFRAAGWGTDIFDGSTLASCRMYEDFRSVWLGFGKSGGEGMATPVALPMWTLLIVGGHVLPIVLLVAGLASGQPQMAVAGGAGTAFNLVLRLLLCARFKQPLVGALLHPVGACLVLAIQWHALLRYLLGRPNRWRGRYYVGSRGKV